MRGRQITGHFSLFRVSVTNRQTRVRPDCVQNIENKKQKQDFLYSRCLCTKTCSSWYFVEASCVHQGGVSRVMQRSKRFPASFVEINTSVRCRAEGADVTSRLPSSLKRGWALKKINLHLKWSLGENKCILLRWWPYQEFLGLLSCRIN